MSRTIDRDGSTLVHYLPNPNLFINSDFSINQRDKKTGPVSDFGFIADRWRGKDLADVYPVKVTKHEHMIGFRTGLKVKAKTTGTPLIQQTVEYGASRMQGAILTFSLFLISKAHPKTDLSIEIVTDNNQAVATQGLKLATFGNPLAKPAPAPGAATVARYAGTLQIPFPVISEHLTLRVTMPTGFDGVITGVMCEPGEFVTTFNAGFPDQALLACQRYFWQVDPMYSLNGINGRTTEPDVYPATSDVIRYPVNPRVLPSISWKGIGGQSQAQTKIGYRVYASSAVHSSKIKDIFRKDMIGFTIVIPADKNFKDGGSIQFVSANTTDGGSTGAIFMCDAEIPWPVK
ncbi:hypothetical protein [Photobacterium damselae]|uniref:hypothetical protein n=1 Tax=Photobacterium damselae TaxID=38293 RepID=UPI001F30D4FF|nr:hypothetical protein [Photobacterium damselae]UKA12935.1 hypothetical protein IHC91_21355 [Photobacterium damselae subsp. damselae]